MKSRIAIFALICTFGLWSTAGADIIFDNGGTLSVGGLLANSPDSAPADNFTLLEGASAVSSIQWTGYYAPLPAKAKDAPVDDFTVYIFAGDGSAPIGAPLYTLTNDVQSTLHGTSAFGEFPEYDYVMDIDPIDFTPEASYWLAIVNNLAVPDKGGISPDIWAWSYSGINGGDAHQKAATAWIDADVELAFQLSNDGVVPEPATLTLLGVGLVGMAARRRFSRAR